MKNQTLDQMPAEVATSLLTSRQSMSNRFKKNCQRARERVVEPQSRSTRLTISAPRTGAQKLQVRLGKASAKQLLTLGRRTLRRANRLQDARDKVSFTNDNDESKALVELLTNQIAAHDALCEAINIELTARSTRGIGYRKPVKFKVEKIKLIIV